MSLPPLLASMSGLAFSHSLKSLTNSAATLEVSPSSKKVDTATLTSVPLAASRMTELSQVSPARIGILTPAPAAWVMICAA